MKCILPGTIVLLICLCHAPSAQAQKKSFLEAGSWKISIVAGASGLQSTGSLVKNFKDNIDLMNDTSAANRQVSGKALPVISYVAGLRFHKILSDKFSAEAGLQLTQRGYQLKHEIKSADPDYQFDEQAIQHVRVKATVIEVPLAALYSFSAKHQVELALQLGIGLKQSTKAEITYENKVTINGTKDEAWSIPTQTARPDFRPYLQTFIPAVSASYYRTIYKDLRAGIGFQYSAASFSTPEGKAGGIGAIIQLKYVLDPTIF
jgi:hypothetical protein